MLGHGRAPILPPGRVAVPRACCLCYAACVNAFTSLERAALRAIFAETPDLAADLERQLERSTVVERENSGGGFYATIAVAADVPRVAAPPQLGVTTCARIEGLEHGLGFVLFMKDGVLDFLEGFAWGPESTAALDLHCAAFEIVNAPPDLRP